MSEYATLPASPDGWAFFLDVDGTLIDIADTPDAVTVPPDLPDTLARLARRTDGAVALVSGRTIATLDRLFAPTQLAAAGVHGAEIRWPDGARRAFAGPGLDLVRGDLAELQRRHPRLLIEDKGAAVAVHYRAQPELGPAVAAALRASIASESGLSIQPGKMVFEVRPAGADKGRALEALMAKPPFAGRRPLAVGDDLTDESMFGTAVDLGGLAVRVGRDGRASIAEIHIESPARLRKWLSDLLGDTR